MKKTNVFFLTSIFMLVISCNNGTFAERELDSLISINKPLTWEEQIEYAKNKSIVGTRTNPDGICLKGHTHYGTITSESGITRLIEQLFAEQTPIGINGDQKNFEIVTIGTIMQMGRDSGCIDPFEFLKCELKEAIQLGMELIELEWEYKNNIYYSTAIASNDHGDIIYDHIGHMIQDDCPSSHKVEAELGVPIVKTRSENYKKSDINFVEADYRPSLWGSTLWLLETSMFLNSMNLHGPMHTVRPHQSQ